MPHHAAIRHAKVVTIAHPTAISSIKKPLRQHIIVTDHDVVYSLRLVGASRIPRCTHKSFSKESISMMKRTFGIALLLTLAFSEILHCGNAAMATPQQPMGVAVPQQPHQPATLLEKILSDPSLASDDPKKSIDALMNIMAQLSPEEIALLDAEINANFDQNQRAELEQMGNSVLQELGYLAPETPGAPAPQIVIPQQTHAEIVTQGQTNEAEIRNLELLISTLETYLKSLQHKLAIMGALHAPWHEDLADLIRYLAILRDSSTLPALLKNEFHAIPATLRDLKSVMELHEPRYATGISSESSDDSPYDLLGITSNATQAEIDDAYEQLKSSIAPEVIRSELIKQGFSGKDLARSVKDAQRAWSMIEDAYEQLSDKNMRAQIDRAQINERKSAEIHRAQSEDALAAMRQAINEMVYQQQLLVQLQMFLQTFEPEKMAALQKFAKESEARIKEQAARFEREKSQVGKEYIMLDKWRQVPYWSNNAYNDPMSWGQWPYAGWNDSPYLRDAWRDLDRAERRKEDARADKDTPKKQEQKKKTSEEDKKKKQKALDKLALDNMRKDLKKRTENIRSLIKEAETLLAMTAQASEKNGRFPQLFSALHLFLQAPVIIAENGAAPKPRKPIHADEDHNDTPVSADHPMVDAATMTSEEAPPLPALEPATDTPPVPTADAPTAKATHEVAVQTDVMPPTEEEAAEEVKKPVRKSKRSAKLVEEPAVVTLDQLKKQALQLAEDMLKLRKETHETELAMVLEKISTIASLDKDTKSVRDAANAWQNVAAKYRQPIQNLVNALREIVENPKNVPEKASMLINSPFNQGTVVSMQLELLTNIARIMDEISIKMPRQKKEPRTEEPKVVYVTKDADDEDAKADAQYSEGDGLDF